MTLRLYVIFIMLLTLVAGACGTGSAGGTAPEGSPADPVVLTSTTAPASTTSPPATSPTTRPSTSTTTVRQEQAPVDIESTVGGTLSGDGWLVEPGSYSAEVAGTLLRIGITGPAAYIPFDGSITFGIPGTGGLTSDLVDFTTFVGVIDPDSVGIHPDHDKKVPDETVPIPMNLTDWFEAVPQVQIEAMSEIDGASMTGFVWDIRIDDEAGPTFPCQFGNCVAFLVNESWGPYVMGTGARFRVWQFTGSADGIFGFMQAHPAKYDETTALADMLLAGLEIQGPVG